MLSIPHASSKCRRGGAHSLRPCSPFLSSHPTVCSKISKTTWMTAKLEAKQGLDDARHHHKAACGGVGESVALDLL